ncbi:MAG: HD domain-containing protein [Chitinivibrionales bacterium]|nr:HD domain-containing protein [Chitinivibrionales bacterium]
MMKSIDINDLQIGHKTKTDLYAESGDLLISEGVIISGKIVSILNRRNIFTLYYQPTQQEELDELINQNKRLEELSLDIEKSDANRSEPFFPPQSVVLSREFGRKGFDELMQSKSARLLDSDFKKGMIADRPFGKPLERKAKAPEMADRTQSYKNEQVAEYHRALAQTRSILNTVANTERLDGQEIKRVVQRFVNLYKNDYTVLYNLATIKQKNDDYLYSHSLNTCLIAISIAAAAGYSEQQVTEAGMGALLHDIGMLHIHPDIRNKNARLTVDEWYEVQKHPIIGLHLLEKVKNLPRSVPFVAYQCHERENAKGYPKHRRGRMIHRFAKIVQIADVFTAYSSPRSYRPARTPYQSMAFSIKLMRQGFISGELLRSFLQQASLFPLGSIVELDNMCLAKVIKSNESSFGKPVVKVIADRDGNIFSPVHMKVIDLKDDNEHRIARAHGPEAVEHADVLTGL